jgi:hypothetical protein
MTSDPVQILQCLVPQYRFNPYRAWRAFPQRVQADVLMAEITAARPPKTAASVHVAGNGEAAAVARLLEWDSTFFRTPMARIEHVFGENVSARGDALEASLKFLQSRDIRHVSANIDAADNEAAVLLERRGFRLSGGAVTYTARPRKPPVPVTKRGHVRSFRSEDGAELVALAEESLRGLRGRFHLDAALPRDAVESFYIEWARRCISYEMADTVLVSEGPDGRLLGFVAFRRLEPVSTISGVPVFGAGLAACRRDSRGAYPGLLQGAISHAHQSGGMVEVQTQNYNAAAIGVQEAVGLRWRRASYNFHLWLGDHAIA